LTGKVDWAYGLTTMNALAGNRLQVPPHLFFVGSAVFHYLGPSFAVLLFARVPVAGVAWLRIFFAALVFAIWRRPWRAFLACPPSSRALIAALGGVFAIMNYSFYMAIDRLPLGTVAAIEFVGPILLALSGSRTLRNIAALVAATAGVYLLVDVRWAGEPAAFMWAFVNGALFMLYIVLAHALANSEARATVTAPSGAGSRISAIDRLGAAMLIAAIAVTPLGWHDALPAWRDPVALLAGAGVGISSSVIPYVFDQLAMSRMPRATYALFVAMLPAMAVLIGVLVLQQVPALVEIAGIALVGVGVALHRPASASHA
jgi:inner membrane transporter RhtA